MNRRHSQSSNAVPVKSADDGRRFSAAGSLILCDSNFESYFSSGSFPYWTAQGEKPKKLPVQELTK
jgi:hypothetical protein